MSIKNYFYKKRVYKELKKQNRIRNVNGKVEVFCNCDNWVDVDSISDIHIVNLNYFNWWHYKMLDEKDEDGMFKYEIELNDKYKPFCYIGYVPLLKEIPYYFYEYFGKKDYALIIDCENCENLNEDGSE